MSSEITGPRVFAGGAWKPVTPPTGGESPIPPEADGDGTIFVSLASYRDGERCADTIQSIFDNASNPDKVAIALVEQAVPADAFCLEKYCEKYGAAILDRDQIRKDVTKVKVVPDEREKCPRMDQIRQVAFHSLAAKGPTYARSLVRKVLGNEEYCLQIDSHSTFAKDWDVVLKEEWKATGNEFGVISSVPPDKSEMNDLKPGGSKKSEVPRSCRVRFLDNGFPDFEANKGPTREKAVDLDKPLLTGGWSAALSFAKCHLEESAPYDPFSWYAKPLEQFTRYARMWTRGYDVYTPTRNVIFHDGQDPANGHGGNEWFSAFHYQKDRLRKIAIARAKTVLSMPDGAERDVAKANMGLYHIGKRRSLEQLEEFTNVKLKEQKGNVGTNMKCSEYEWVPYDKNMSPMENMYGSPDNLEPQPEYAMRTKLTFYEQIKESVTTVDVDIDGAGATDGRAGDLGDAQPIMLGDEHMRADLPPLAMLLPLWMFGLVVWCVIFMNPNTKAPARRPRRKPGNFKDV